MLQPYVVQPKTRCCTLTCVNLWPNDKSNVVPPIVMLHILVQKRYSQIKSSFTEHDVENLNARWPFLFKEYHRIFLWTGATRFNLTHYQDAFGRKYLMTAQEFESDAAQVNLQHFSKRGTTLKCIIWSLIDSLNYIM